MKPAAATTTAGAIVPAAETARGRGPAPSAPLTASVENGRLCVSVSSGASAVAVFLIGSLVAGAYLVGLRVGGTRGEASGFERGRAWYEAEVAGDIEQARARPPVPDLIAGLEVQRGAASPPSVSAEAASTAPGKTRASQGPATTWVAGNNYVVVQGFAPGAERDAESAREFLQREGIESAVVPMSNGWHRLITTQGFNLADAPQKGLAERLMEKIRQAGQRFQAAGGQYDFHDCYLVKLEKDAW